MPFISICAFWKKVTNLFFHLYNVYILNSYLEFEKGILLKTLAGQVVSSLPDS
jgi:hypothetical protein